MIHSLVRIGRAEVDIKDMIRGSGYTPLHSAAEGGNESTARALLELGADPFNLSDFRERPIDIVPPGPGGMAVQHLLAQAMGIEIPAVSGVPLKFDKMLELWMLVVPFGGPLSRISSDS